MSIATGIRPRGRKARPKLKVVGGERRPPRHRVVWDTYPLANAVEFWTEAEWAVLEAWERPDNAGFLPGVGYVSITLAPQVSRDDVAEIAEEYSAAIREWRDLRGIES